MSGLAGVGLSITFFSSSQKEPWPTQVLVLASSTCTTAAAAARTNQQKKKRKTNATCPPKARPGGAGPNPLYDAFAAAHPKFSSLVDSALAKDGTGVKYSAAHDTEAVEAMEKFGAKDEIGTLRSYDDEDHGGGSAATGASASMAPLGAGWIVAVAASDILTAAKKIEAGASSGDISLNGVGGPAMSDMVDGHIQIRVSWHSNAGDLSAVAKERIDTIQEEEKKSAANVEKKAPDEICLPPRFPDVNHSVEEILQQYEEYFEVDGVCYSPIRDWGNAIRPKTVSSSRFSMRLQQYCGAKIKGSEDPDMNQNAMKKAGIEWADTVGGKKNWKNLAEKAYSTGSGATSNIL